ncbi:putative glycoside protein [Pseudomonas phage MR14]|nr:putative glycoside protein [Pseudomonas phage MR14]
MNAEKLSAAAGIPLETAQLWAEPLTVAMAQFDINTSKRQAQFLAQVGHESGGFKRLVENLNYDDAGLARVWPGRFSSGTGPNELAREIARQPEKIANAAYGLRMGNNAQGDGWLYRGRGLIQLTGKANYQAASNALGYDLVAEPDQVAEPPIAALTAAWFWQKNGLNQLADSGDTRAVTRRINGGTTGLDDRLARYTRAAKVLGA